MDRTNALKAEAEKKAWWKMPGRWTELFLQISCYTPASVDDAIGTLLRRRRARVIATPTAVATYALSRRPGSAGT